jgi:RNA polymerase sigma factor (sigma-70 family)
MRIMASAPLHTIVRHLRHAVVASGETGLSDAELLRRFVATRDDAAFELLVWRHGSLVWGVCRRVLRQEQDAEDAFQATFLVLARRAATIGRGEAVAGWLYQVALRLARAARARAAARARHERRAVPAGAADDDPVIWPDLRPVLDDEIGRLPEKYRRPFLLCYLEGKTTDQAARELGCPRGTVGTRLAWARERLRLRLSRRGVTLGAGAGALLAATRAPALPLDLPAAAVRGALVAAAGSLPPTPAAALAASGLRAMLLAQLRAPVAVVLTAILLVMGAAIAARQEPASPAAEPQQGTPTAPAARLDGLGDPLPAGALLRLGTAQFRHGHLINAVALSPDGKLVASAGGPAASVLALWDAATGKEVRRLHGHAGWLLAVAFSPDGRTLASAGHEWEVYLWDVATGKQTLHLQGHQAGVHALAFSKDGKRLASASDDATVRVWDRTAGKELHRLEGHAGPVHGVAFSADGKLVATAGADGTIRLWDADGKTLRTLDGPARGANAVAFSPDGKAVAAAGEDGTVRLWQTADGKVLHRLAGHEGPLRCVAFAPDGSTVASAGDDSTLRLWDAATGKQRRKLEGRMRQPRSLAFSADGRTVITGSWEGVVRLWDVAGGKELLAGPGHEDWVRTVAYSPDGRTLATGGNDDTLRLWDAAGKERLRVGLRGRVTSVAFSPDGKLLLTGTEDAVDAGRRGEVQLWDTATGHEVRSFAGNGGAVRCVAFAPDGKLVAAGCADRIIYAWDAATGKAVCRFEGTDNADGLSCAFSPDGRMLFSGSDDATLRFWHTATGKPMVGPLVNFQGRAGQVHAVAFSPDGQLVAAAGKDGVAQVWELGTGALLRRFEGRFGEVGALAFSPDGRILAAGGWGQGLCVWDVSTGQERARLVGHRGDVTALAFSPDGKRLASTGGDTTALVWDVTALPKAPGAAELSPAELEGLWADLAGADAVRAWSAVWRLSASPPQALPLARDYLAHAADADPRRIKRLIAELDDDAFAVRERASEELEKLGAAAELALRAALAATGSAEVRQRVTRLLDKLAAPGGQSEARRLPRLVTLLELLATPEARRALEAAAKGDADARLTRDAAAALQRLNRLAPAR